MTKALLGLIHSRGLTFSMDKQVGLAGDHAVAGHKLDIDKTVTETYQ